MVHLALLTPAWPADLFGGGGANIDRKNVLKRIQSPCAQHTLMNAHTFGARAMR